MINKTSTEHLQAPFLRNGLTIWKILTKKRIVNFLLVYISSILKIFRRKLELQTVDSVQNWDSWPLFFSLTDLSTVFKQVFASTDSHKAIESIDIL